MNIANNIKYVYPKFESEQFIIFTMEKLPSLSFGDRSNLITKNLHSFLPKNFRVAVDFLVDSLGPEIAEPEIKGFDGFYVLPLSNYVSIYGLSEEYYDISINALYEMTKRFSSEGAIRSFIRKYPRETYKILIKWTADSNPHVRRLASEGSRPRLPLAAPLRIYQKDPTPLFKLLNLLKEDPILFVRRSVANNLNDISKDNSERLVKLLSDWMKTENEDTKWIVKHALRTLLKQGHQGALLLLGYNPEVKIDISNLRLKKTNIKIGETLQFSFDILSQSKKQQKIMIDYKIYFMKASGKQKPKVFKLAKKSIIAKELLTFSSKQSFKQMSTRKHYQGTHKLIIVINGREKARIDFQVR